MLALGAILTYSFPFRGTIQAGWPSPAEEELGDQLTFEEWLVPHKEASSLVTVATDAMKEAGIMPDDIVIMERGRTPQRGDIVIAEVDGQTMIRHYEIDKLVAANHHYQPITPTEDTRILGVVTSVIRRYR
ncbi:MAG: S24 family peptidase [Candidatus Andersenbacteria bacterium]